MLALICKLIMMRWEARLSNLFKNNQESFYLVFPFSEILQHKNRDLKNQAGFISSTLSIAEFKI